MTGPVRKGALFVAACGGIFMFGIVLALLGTLFGLPGMRARLGIDLAGQGDVLLALFAGIFASTVLAGPIIDRIGTKSILVVSSCLVAVALVLLANAHGFTAAAFGAFVLGLGGGGLNTANNVLVSDMFDEDRGQKLNILGTFFGVGALVIPFTTATLSSHVGIGSLLVGAAALALACSVAYTLLPFPPGRGGAGASPVELIKVLRWPGVLLFASVLFFQSGNEAAIGGWTSTYIGQMGWSPQTATSVLAGTGPP